MIKAVVADVDGVIVGKHEGVNFPLPHTDVIKKLKQLRGSGIPVVLCTAKFSHAIGDIVHAAQLDNPHISDGGALILNPLQSKIVTAHTLDKALVRKVITACLDADAYMECYSVNDYYVEKGQVHDFTENRIRILHKPHQEVDSLLDHVDRLDIIKLIAFGKTPEQKTHVEQALKPFEHQIYFIWGQHPAMLPIQAGIITQKGVSKKHATEEVLASLSIDPADTLGVGDAATDWNFMDICGYAASVGSDNELQKLVRTKGAGKYLIAPSVDENGFVNIVDFFVPNI